MASEELRARITDHLQRELKQPVQLAALEPLAGGACQDNWRLDLSIEGRSRRYVLRSDSAGSLPGSLGRKVELAVVRAAHAAGVKTPDARWPGEGLVRAGGYAYFLDWISGEAIGRRVVKSPELEGARAKLPEQLAEQL